MSNRFNNPVVGALLVGIGGAVGVGLRYVCIVFFSGIALWLVNGIGSFLLAYMNEKVRHTKYEQLVRLVVMTGMLGSFTTFSSVSYEWLQLMQQHVVLSIAYAFGMTTFCIIAAYFGRKVVKK